MAQLSNLLDELVLAEINCKITTKAIGAGAYGKVFIAEYYGSVCAAKEFNSNLSLGVSSKGVQKMKENLLKKCQRIFQLRHPNIVQFLGAYYKPGSPVVPLLVMEMMDCSLNVLLNDYPSIPIDVKLSILLGVSLGLKFLHSQKPSGVHCNLSSNNILLTSHLQAKISDVGVALIVPEKLLKKHMKNTCFVAPEICKLTGTAADKVSFDFTVDIFSYGAIILHTITQQWPELKRQLNSKVNQYQSYIDKVNVALDDKEFCLLVVRCLDDDPTKRPQIDKVSEKIKKLTEKYAAKKMSVIAWQMEFQQVLKQKNQLENQMKSYKEQSVQKQKEILQLKQDNDLLRKQIQDITKEGDSTLQVSNLQMTVRDLQEQLELKTAEIVDLNMQINSLHQQLLDTRIRSEKEVYTNPNKKEDLSSRKLTINSEVHKYDDQSAQENLPNEDSLGTFTSSKDHKNLMTSTDANNDPKDTVGTSDVTSHVSPFMKLAKVKLSYDFDEHGPKVVELCNLGNTCYFNSMLQCINQTVGLHYAVAEGEREYVIYNDKKESLTVTVPASNGRMTRELRKFLTDISMHEYWSVSPSDLLEALSDENKRFGRGTEEDSHEALRCILSALRQEEIKDIENEITNKLSNSEDTNGDVEVKLNIKNWMSEVSRGITAIDDLIGIRLVSTVVCHDCAIPLQIEDLHMDLSLPMPLNTKEEVHLADRVEGIVKSKKELNIYLKEHKYHHAHSASDDAESSTGLEQALSDFTDLDILDENNKFACQNCNKSEITELQRVSRLILIHDLSPVLILQLKRFSIGSYGVVKDGAHVSFPLVLNMTPYCTSECIQKRADKNLKIQYGLYAVVVHHGSSLHSGHYTAFVRQRPALELKKQLVEKILATQACDHDAATIGKWYYASDSFVTAVHEFSEVQRCEAYLLFYEQLATYT